MQLNRPDTTAVATAVAASALASLATGLISRANHARHHAPVVKYRNKTLGCEPDPGPYLDGPLLLPTVTGVNQGVAITMLRDLVDEDAESTTDAVPLIGPDAPGPADEESDAAIFDAILSASGENPNAGPIIGLPYEDGLRSAIEVVIVLASELATHDMNIDHECEDEECEASNMGPAAAHMWATNQTARRLLETALAYERHGAMHAHGCRRCRKAAEKAPFFLRARLCRDLADDMLTNDTDDTVRCHGVPIATALDVAKTLVGVIEGVHGISGPAQMDRLAQGVAARIGVVESEDS